MSLNVNRNISDMFYRYKMPKLLAKVEGKGNGIKTVIVNMVDIAKALGRPPTYPTKYFGCEVGAQTQFDFKEERFIVNGSHDASKLQDLLDGFIRKFVLCQECENPETVLSVSKKELLKKSCKACGFSSIIKGNHRLIQYIIKNPPEINPTSQGAPLTERKERKRNIKKQNGNGSPRPEDDDDLNDTFNGTSGKLDEHEDDDDWAVDVSAEAVRARQQDLSEGVKSLAINEDSQKPEKERMDIFYKLLEGKLKNNGGKYDDKELVGEAERLDIRAKATLVLAELFFNVNIVKQVTQHRVALLRFCHQNTKAQKYLIGGIEQVIGLHRDELLPKVALILKAFYDADILDEDVLKDWHSKVSKKYVSKEMSQAIHAKAEPFIKWLMEAEEESSEEEVKKEESDVEIEYDDRARITKLTAAETVAPPKSTASAPTNNEQNEDDDDLDIDAI